MMGLGAYDVSYSALGMPGAAFDAEFEASGLGHEYHSQTEALPGEMGNGRTELPSDAELLWQSYRPSYPTRAIDVIHDTTSGPHSWMSLSQTTVRSML